MLPADVRVLRLQQSAGGTQGIHQLAHIAGPVVGAQRRQQVRLHRDAALGLQRLQGTLQQGVQVAALAQCRQLQRKAVQTVVQVFAEQPGGHGAGQVAVGGADEREIDRHRLAAAERLHLALLQHAQQPRLQCQRHIANLVQKQRAALGLADAPRRTLAPCAGESAAGIAEQFGLDQVLRQGGAVDGDKSLAPAPAAGVHGLGKKLLTYAGLTLQQKRNRLVQHLVRAADGGVQLGVAGVQRSQRIVGQHRQRRADGYGHARGACGAALDAHPGHLTAQRVQHLGQAPLAPVLQTVQRLGQQL